MKKRQFWQPVYGMTPRKLTKYKPSLQTDDTHIPTTHTPPPWKSQRHPDVQTP